MFRKIMFKSFTKVNRMHNEIVHCAAAATDVAVVVAVVVVCHVVVVFGACLHHKIA